MSTIQEIAPGCFRLQTPFHLHGFINIKTHMNFIKLNSGRFVALSAVTLDEKALAQVNQLTQNGQLLEAVVGTNPFHTLAFKQFYDLFPNAKFYGTPRHIRNLDQIKWEGSVADELVRSLWSPEIEMRIPDGCEFDAPKPENLNHFNGIIAFHRASGTLDDAFSVITDPSPIAKLFGSKQKRLVKFFLTFKSQGINKTPDAPRQFYDFWVSLLKDWEFDNLATAHGDFLIGGGKKALLQCLEKEKGALSRLAVANGGIAF
ncbi:UNVERIFIED_CONTAM: hypothetical protein HDU68_005203 [Siphonaria sp. JEL0065]|nr:hypothetical protein HDU68_005203 [Siphonaria sp. JEL0065]